MKRFLIRTATILAFSLAAALVVRAVTGDAATACALSAYTYLDLWLTYEEWYT